MREFFSVMPPPPPYIPKLLLTLQFCTIELTFGVGVVIELVPLVLLVVKHVRNPRVTPGQIDDSVTI